MGKVRDTQTKALVHQPLTSARESANTRKNEFHFLRFQSNDHARGHLLYGTGYDYCADRMGFTAAYQADCA